MKAFRVAMATSAALFLGGAVVLAQEITRETQPGQTGTGIGNPIGGATLTIAPAQRTTIRQHVVEKKIRPVVLKDRVTVGATLPADVELVAVPNEWGPDLVKYRFFHWDNRVVFVEPSSRRVVQIVD